MPAHPSSHTTEEQQDAWPARFATWATDWTGSTAAFMLAAGTILIWLVTGPLFHYSDTWQLVINTGTTIITFLMVFLIQRAQNKDSRALHLKLNELLAAMPGASNRLIDAEDFSEQELLILRGHFEELIKRAEEHGDLTESHSIEDARERSDNKEQSDN